jgi:hypothetical protein
VRHAHDRRPADHPAGPDYLLNLLSVLNSLKKSAPNAGIVLSGDCGSGTLPRPFAPWQLMHPSLALAKLAFVGFAASRREGNAGLPFRVVTLILSWLTFSWTPDKDGKEPCRRSTGHATTSRRARRSTPTPAGCDTRRSVDTRPRLRTGTRTWFSQTSSEPRHKLGKFANASAIAQALLHRSQHSHRALRSVAAASTGWVPQPLWMDWTNPPGDRRRH